MIMMMMMMTMMTMMTMMMTMMTMQQSNIMREREREEGRMMTMNATIKN